MKCPHCNKTFNLKLKICPYCGKNMIELDEKERKFNLKENERILKERKRKEEEMKNKRKKKRADLLDDSICLGDLINIEYELFEDDYDRDICMDDAILDARFYSKDD